MDVDRHIAGVQMLPLLLQRVVVDWAPSVASRTPHLDPPFMVHVDVNTLVEFLEPHLGDNLGTLDFQQPSIESPRAENAASLHLADLPTRFSRPQVCTRTAVYGGSS